MSKNIYYIQNIYEYERAWGMGEMYFYGNMRIFNSAGVSFLVYCSFEENFLDSIRSKKFVLGELYTSSCSLLSKPMDSSYLECPVEKINDIFYTYVRWEKVRIEPYKDDGVILETAKKIYIKDYSYFTWFLGDTGLWHELDLSWTNFSSFADTPEQLLVLQAEQEWKIMTTEQAKETAKDWHFGGVR